MYKYACEVTSRELKNRMLVRIRIVVLREPEEQGKSQPGRQGQGYHVEAAIFRSVSIYIEISSEVDPIKGAGQLTCPRLPACGPIVT
jgi:hypothetical protein